MFEEKNKEEIKPVIPDPKAPPIPSRLPGELISEVMKTGSGKGKMITFLIMGFIILGGISIVGYFLYQRFFGPQEAAPEVINKNINHSPSASLSENEQIICYLKNNPSALNFFAAGKVREAYQRISSQADNCQAQANVQGLMSFPLLSQDKDADGLNAYAESRIGTDDTKSDTDGDSHDDLSEINNGYNPAGPGKQEVFNW